MQFLQQARRVLVMLETYLAAGSLLLLLMLALAQIIARNLFDSGLPIADILTRHLVLYVIFFGAVLAVERQRHIKIDVFCTLLSPRSVIQLYRPMQAVASFVCLLLSDAAIRFWRVEWAYVSEYERWQVLVGLIIPTGFVLLTLHLLLATLLGPNQNQEDHY